MIAVPRRFKCHRCSRVQSYPGELPPTISCPQCKGPVLEIDKLGNPLPLTLERAPAVERIVISKDVTDRARVLILSALEE